MQQTIPNRLLTPAMRSFDAIQFRPVHWIWPARIPRGRLTLLIGDPGVGKSLLTADLAARVSTGNPWPDAGPLVRESLLARPPAGIPSGSESSVPDDIIARAMRAQSLYYKGNVIIVSPEDHADDTLQPRLTAAGADLTTVWTLDGLRPVRLRSTFPPALRGNPSDAYDLMGFSKTLDVPIPLMLPDHADLLAQAVRAVDHPSILILDPLHAILSPGAIVNPALASTAVACLNEIAGSYGVAILAVSHLSKSRSGRTLYRARGALSLIAAARSVLLLAADPCDANRRILAPLKSVYTRPPPPLTFRIADGPRVEWETAADAALAPAAIPSDLLDLTPEAHSALAEACTWLADALIPGPRPAAELIAKARTAGISPITLRRAKRLLAIQSIKHNPDVGWLWFEPDCPPPNPHSPIKQGDQIQERKP